jgi:hypothetical protein
MRYSKEHRLKAAALNAADAKVLLNKSLPRVLRILTPAQIEQAQMVMDAAVVNPVVKKEYEVLRKQSIRAQSGDVIMRDENIVRQADKAWEMMIQPRPEDYGIRLDFTRLLTSDALTPETDNPDEAAFWQSVRGTLMGSGVWLRIGQPQVSAFTLDPRVFSVWLSVGPNGDDFATIPSNDGQLTRESLLKTKTFGARYSREVNHGYVIEQLRREMDRLLREINAGVMQHQILARIRRRAFPGVTAISDALGGASFPDESIWDLPHRLVLKAMHMNIGGRDVMATRDYLLAAALVTRKCARLLAEYVDDSTAGAGSAVTILNIAKTAGEVAEIGLVVTGAAAVVRGGTRMAATHTASETNLLLEKEFSLAVSRNPGLANELRGVTRVPGPKGTVLGKSGTSTNSRVGSGWDKW